MLKWELSNLGGFGISGTQGVQHPWCERFKLQSADNAEFVLIKSVKTSVAQRIQPVRALGVLIIEDLIIL